MRNQVSRVKSKSIRSLIQELVATPQIASFYEWGNCARAQHTRTHTHAHIRLFVSCAAKWRRDVWNRNWQKRVRHCTICYMLVCIIPSVTETKDFRDEICGSWDQIVCYSWDSQSSFDINSIRCPRNINQFAGNILIKLNYVMTLRLHNVN